MQTSIPAKTLRGRVRLDASVRDLYRALGRLDAAVSRLAAHRGAR